MAIVETRNLSAFYGKAQALTDINIAVEEGEIVGIIGANGAGKSTLLDAIMGLVKTGGHEDQLSQRYPAMDRFRITALANLLRGANLDSHQYTMAQQTLANKIHIYCQGALKRGKVDHVKSFTASYADLSDDKNNISTIG